LSNYEFVAVFDATQTEEAIEAATAQVRQVLVDHECDITYVETWGRRRMAYEIARKVDGHYVIFYFRAGKGKSPGLELERYARINDIMLRHLLVTVPKLKTEADAQRELALREASRKAAEEASAARAEAEAAKAAEAEAAKAAEAEAAKVAEAEAAAAAAEAKAAEDAPVDEKPAEAPLADETPAEADAPAEDKEVPSETPDAEAAPEGEEAAEKPETT
jgi:ribosomal protein S6